MTIVRGTFTSLNHISIDKQISMYPNPVKDILNIDCPSKINTIEIYDFKGSFVQSAIGNNEINLAQLKSGFYLIKVKTDQAEFHQKIIKD